MIWHAVPPTPPNKGSLHTNKSAWTSCLRGAAHNAHLPWGLLDNNTGSPNWVTAKREGFGWNATLEFDEQAREPGPARLEKFIVFLWLAAAGALPHECSGGAGEPSSKH